MIKNIKGNKNLLNIIGIIAGVIIIIVIIEAFTGNDFTRRKVKELGNKYIKETYAGTDYYIEDVKYNFKNSGYDVLVKSKESLDTYFALSYNRSGKLKKDSFETSVGDKFNTWLRISTDYRKLAEEVLNDESFKYKTTIKYGDLMLRDDVINEALGKNLGFDMNSLELDQTYDYKILGSLYGNITLYVEDKDVSAKKAGEILLYIKQIFDEKEVTFKSISLVLKKPGNNKKDSRINIESFLYSDIYKEDIEERILKEHEALNAYYEREDSK